MFVFGVYISYIIQVVYICLYIYIFIVLFATDDTRAIIYSHLNSIIKACSSPPTNQTNTPSTANLPVCSQPTLGSTLLFFTHGLDFLYQVHV